MSVFKSCVRRALSSVNIYPAVKYSDVYDLYCSFFLRGHWEEFQKKVHFYESILGSDSVVFDVGANCGGNADIFRRFAKRVVCVEPDRGAVRILEQRFHHRSNVIIVAKAIGDRAGLADFFVEKTGSPFNTLSSKWKEALESVEETRFVHQLQFRESYPVSMTTLDILIRDYGMPDYIKLDVEGFELNALRGLSAPVRFVSFEANLPHFLAETIDCVSLLHILSPDLKFAYSMAEGFGGELTGWLDPADFVGFVKTTSSPFLEVLAQLQPTDCQIPIVAP